MRCMRENGQTLMRLKGRTELIDGKPALEKIRPYYKGKRLPQWDTKWLVAQ